MAHDKTWRERWLTPPRLLIYLCLIVLLIWFTWGFVAVKWVAHFWQPKPNDGTTILGTLGQTGDLFGGANAIFAAMALVAVAIAAYYQRQSWKLLVSTETRSSFESLFFELLRRIEPPAQLQLASLAPPANVYAIPAQSLHDAAGQLRARLETTAEWKARFKPGGPRFEFNGEVERLWESFYLENEPTLGPYFRSLYHLFKLITFSDLSEPRKVERANIARATLDVNQLLLLTLNCASPRGREFRPIVEYLGLLKHVRHLPGGDSTIDRKLAECLYKTAYMSHKDRTQYWENNPGPFARLKAELMEVAGKEVRTHRLNVPLPAFDD